MDVFQRRVRGAPGDHAVLLERCRDPRNLFLGAARYPGVEHTVEPEARGEFDVRDRIEAPHALAKERLVHRQISQVGGQTQGCAHGRCPGVVADRLTTDRLRTTADVEGDAVVLRSSRIILAMRSPVMMAGRLVPAIINVGNSEVSATRKPSTPNTLPRESVTAEGSLALPMRQVPQT